MKLPRHNLCNSNMAHWQNKEGSHSLSSSVSALNCLKTEWSRIPIGIWQAYHMILWIWQETMSNPQWYEKFNTKVDVGSAIGITWQHKVLLEYVAQENHTLTFAELSAKQKQAVREDTEECYISYAFLCQSVAQHGNLKLDLRNDVTTSSNQYPKTHQQTLHLLHKYSKTVDVPKTTPSEGLSFAQKGGRGGRGGRGWSTITYDKEYWKDKTCFNWGKKGYPSSSCSKMAVAGAQRQWQCQHCAQYQEAHQGHQDLKESLHPTSEDKQTRLQLVWLQIRRRGFRLSVWRWIPVHANDDETDGNQIWTTNCQTLQTNSWHQDQTWPQEGYTLG